MNHGIYWAIFMLLSGLAGCAHPTSSEVLRQRQNENRAQSAAYGSDHFYNDPDYPERKRIPNDNFFFKKCHVDSFAPYPVQNQWECTEAIR